MCIFVSILSLTLIHVNLIVDTYRQSDGTKHFCDQTCIEHSTFPISVWNPKCRGLFIQNTTWCFKCTRSTTSINHPHKILSPIFHGPHGHGWCILPGLNKNSWTGWQLPAVAEIQMDCIVQVLLLLLMWWDAEQSATFARKHIRWNDGWSKDIRINTIFFWNMNIVFGGNLNVRFSKFQLTWSGWRTNLRSEQSTELQAKLRVLRKWNDF